ncbi:hypothetical protein BH09MYX1_BH09MYX1_24820 [soil metagenome]
MVVRHRALLVLLFALVAAAFAACGTEGDDSVFPDSDGGADGNDASVTDDTGNPFQNDGGTVDPDAAGLHITPLDAVVTVNYGSAAAPIAYQALYDGKPVAASWSLDRGELADLNVGTGVLTPKGSLGGKGTVTASYQGKLASTTVTVKLKWEENGKPVTDGGVDSGADSGGGAGGNGGVGGEGPGNAVPTGTVTILNGAPTADQGLSWLYPYDATVWPRGILAPLMMWKPGAQTDYDAVYIHITENSFEYKGYFAKTATPFIHHPIPQGAWKALAYSNGGEDVTVELTFAKGNVAYGPISEKWKIANGALKGTVYYNSYGTNLAKNYCCATGNKPFGGATLAIQGDSTGPTLVSGNDQKCRVCHSVSADGSMLITQSGDSYSTAEHINLKNNNVETTLSPTDGRFAWPGTYPDGPKLFSNAAPLAGSSTLPSALYSIPTGSAIATTGLPAGLRAGTPSFSPDGKHVAFNHYAGAGGDAKSLAFMDFTAPGTFGALTNLHTPQTGSDWWPSFLPTNDGVVFQLETVYNGRDVAGTRSTCDSSGSCSDSGTRAQLYWVDLKTKTVSRLDKANGLGNVPTGANGHTDDSTLNYEPTVNPVPSGGYAWVVFTSRRMYGNVATINPFWSDPRYHDISVQPTTKKLWVAAIDLNAPPGTDPSHPAFYLPAQELLAGNSRGFWVVDPCQNDGTSCETGDECCGGYCRGGNDGGLVCTQTPPSCAVEFEKCTTSADCCGTTLACINGRCATKQPN